MKILLTNQKNDDECKKKKESDVEGITGFTPKLLQLLITTMQEDKEKNNTADGKEDNAFMLIFLHESLESLTNMLSTTTTRRFVIVSSKDVAFSTECESCPSSHNDDSNDNSNSKLIKETLN